MLQKSEWFVQYLFDTLGAYSSIMGIETQNPELGMVLGVVYQDYPEPGLTSGFTYGLSAARHPEWKTHKPELCITVESAQDDWISAVAQLVEWNRTSHPFLPGSLFHYGKAIAGDTHMDSFLVFNEAIGEAQPMIPDSQRSVQLQNEIIQIYQIYPLYHNEVELMKKVGIRKFAGLPEYAPYQIQRPDLSQIYQIG